VDLNRLRALETSQSEVESQPENAFAWFNLGTNLVYFEHYDEAADAYDRAEALGLPQRMYRYQFGPFMAYFHSLRTDDLLTLAEYALKRTPTSEEALLWQGWGFYRQGKKSAAVQNFYQALEHHPGYEDALYALDYVNNNP
jgi:tetratricopeptide (TPR) repeat protein